jgi:hypothetical protein
MAISSDKKTAKAPEGSGSDWGKFVMPGSPETSR